VALGAELEADRVEVLEGRQVPPSDGGLSLEQARIAMKGKD